VAWHVAQEPATTPVWLKVLGFHTDVEWQLEHCG
jgi:hypothetical protein